MSTKQEFYSGQFVKQEFEIVLGETFQNDDTNQLKNLILTEAHNEFAVLD